MSGFIIVYWRDIPAQIIRGKGRKAEKIQLSERFEKAIDKCAMKIGSKSADLYLKDWNKKALAVNEKKFDTIQDQANYFENQYDPHRLKNIIENDGWETKPDQTEKKKEY